MLRQPLYLNADGNESFPSTIGKCIEELTLKFSWYRSTYRNTANHFKKIDNYNDVVFLRSISTRGSTGSTNECINTISPDGSWYTEQFIKRSALEKWVFDRGLPPRLLFILVNDSASKTKYFKFCGIYRLAPESTAVMRVYKRISTEYDRYNPTYYNEEI